MTQDSCPPFVSDCPVRAAADLISHTWDPVVLSALRPGPTRRRELLQRIAGVSDKVLSQSLRRLTSRSLVARTGSGPGGTVYALTPLGASFSNGPLAELAQWAVRNSAALAHAGPS